MRMWRYLVGGRRLLFIVGRVPVLLDRMGSAVTAAAAAASDKLEAGSGFPVEDVERRQADVEDFFLTEGEFVTRFDDPRGQICGGAGRLCDCAARQ